MRTVWVALVVVLLSGCGQGQPAPDPGGRVRHWIEKLRAADPRHRQNAAFTLGNLGTVDASVVPALKGALKDTDPEVRCAAVLALLKCGADGKEAIPDLTTLQEKDPDPKVREYAGKALRKLKDRN